jgi:hypothetical protein
MTTFTVHYRTEVQFATTQIEADTPELALATARACVEDYADKLFFEAYTGPSEINEIAICDEDDSDELAVWYDDDLRLRLAADDLLNAAHLVIARWESGDLAEAVRELSAAVVKAEGGTA